MSIQTGVQPNFLHSFYQLVGSANVGAASPPITGYPLATGLQVYPRTNGDMPSSSQWTGTYEPSVLPLALTATWNVTLRTLSNPNLPEYFLPALRKLYYSIDGGANFVDCTPGGNFTDVTGGTQYNIELPPNIDFNNLQLRARIEAQGTINLPLTAVFMVLYMQITYTYEVPDQMYTLTATLDNVEGEPDIGAIMRVVLCNYNAFLPAVPGLAMGVRIISETRQADSSPMSVDLWGNDTINPAGTFYCIQLIDSKKNVVQAANYLLNGSGTHDLSTLTPYDPVPTPTPPPLNEKLEIVPYSDAPVFHANVYPAFKLVLSGSPSVATIDGGVQGNTYTFNIIQDAAGGHTMPWPANCLGFADVDTVANSMTTQTALCVSSSPPLFAASSGGVYYDPATP